jgi:hypothetical protein
MFKILSSKGKRVLVVSDPHIRFQIVEQMIQKEKPNIVIVLGDFFDSHLEIGIGLREQREMAEWLRMELWKQPHPSIITPYEFYGLKGNHDLSYCYLNSWLRCPGYTDHKDFEVSQVMNHDDWDKLNDFIILDDFLLTHAGLSSSHIPAQIQDIKALLPYLTREVIIAHKLRRENVPHWIFNQGYRMGHQNIGGIFWCHAGSKKSPYQEFQPREGIKQIFGHTYQEDGVKVFGETNNFCIDTFLRNYIMVEDGQLSIKSL